MPSSPRLISAADLDFGSHTSVPVISSAQKYVVPIPQYDGGGQPLVYPEGDKAGQVIVDWQGNPVGERGLVFFNGVDKSWQGVKGDGQGVIILNQVNESQAAALTRKIGEFGGDPAKLSVEQTREVLRYAREELDLNDMYNSNRAFISSKMTPVQTESTGMPCFGLHKRDDRDICRAVFVEGKGEFQGPAKTPQIFEDGAVIVKQGDSVRLVQPDIFEQTYRHANGAAIELEQLPRANGLSTAASVASGASKISLAYSGEVIRHSDGVDYAVIDTSRVDFESAGATFGKKTKPTLVRVAKAGEEIVTSPGAVEESRTIAKGGEMIFVNRLPNGKEDAFIPRDGNGVANGQQILEQRYELVGGDVNGEGALFRPKGGPSRLLHEVVDRPTVIKDAWGPGQHQFLDKGATLKSENGRITGIDKAAFDETWSITDQSGRVQVAQKIETSAAQGIETKRFGEQAYSSRPGQDLGAETTDMETGRTVTINRQGRAVGVQQTAHDLEHEGRFMASAPKTAEAATETAAVTNEAKGAAEVAKDAAAVAREAAATEGTVARLIGAAKPILDAVIGPVARAAQLAKPVLPVVKVLGTVAEVGALGVGAYKTATEEGTGPKDKTFFKMQQATGTAFMALDGALQLAGSTPIAETTIEAEKTITRETDGRRFTTTKEYWNAKSAVEDSHIQHSLKWKGAHLDKDGQLDLTIPHNRNLLLQAVTERRDDLEEQQKNAHSLAHVKSWIPKLHFFNDDDKNLAQKAEIGFLNTVIGDLQTLEHSEEKRKGAAAMVEKMQLRDNAVSMSWRHEPGGDKYPTQASAGDVDTNKIVR